MVHGPTVTRDARSPSSRRSRCTNCRCAFRCRMSIASTSAASSPAASRSGTLRVGDTLVFSPEQQDEHGREHRDAGTRRRATRGGRRKHRHHADRADFRRARPRRLARGGRADRSQPFQGAPLLDGQAQPRRGRALQAQAGHAGTRRGDRQHRKSHRRLDARERRRKAAITSPATTSPK